MTTLLSLCKYIITVRTYRMTPLLLTLLHHQLKKWNFVRDFDTKENLKYGNKVAHFKVRNKYILKRKAGEWNNSKEKNNDY